MGATDFWDSIRSMLAWARTERGWVLNLDGTDPTRTLALPRLEVRCDAQGLWTALCAAQDGSTRLTLGTRLGSMAAAQRTALEEARGVLGREYALLLEQLLAEI